jgi:hypothetical protein
MTIYLITSFFTPEPYILLLTRIDRCQNLFLEWQQEQEEEQVQEQDKNKNEDNMNDDGDDGDDKYR